MSLDAKTEYIWDAVDRIEVETYLEVPKWENAWFANAACHFMELERVSYSRSQI